MARVRFVVNFRPKEGGRHLAGDEADVTDDTAARYLRAGVAVPIAEPVPTPRWDDRKVAPSRGARKELWEAFGQLFGYQLSEGLTKQQLIDRYGETVA